jgi:hypothetical protein
MRFHSFTAAAVLMAGTVAALTISPVIAQNKNSGTSSAQNKSSAATAQKKAAKKSHRYCVDLAYRRGFADSDSGGAWSFIYYCKLGQQL